MDNIHNTEPRTKNYMEVTETQENTRSHDSSSDANVTFSPSEITFDSGEAKTIDALKAICKKYDVSTEWAAEDAVRKVFERIEHTHMKLPLDADGVPIHEGDKIQYINESGGTGAHVEVCAVSEHYVFYGEGKHFYKADTCRHVNPETVDSLLEKFYDEVGWDEVDNHAQGHDELVRNYAERIRKAVEQ